MGAIVDTRSENALATWYQTILFIPPILPITPSSAESFNKQLGTSPIDLKARLKCPGGDPNVTLDLADRCQLSALV